MEVYQAILLSGVVAAAIAIAAICSNRSIAAKRATLDIIRSSEGDVEMIAARQKFNEATRSPEGAKRYASQPTSDEFNRIMTVLNEYELVAIGIQAGILDDKTYRQWHEKGVIQAWEDAEAFVRERRNLRGNDRLWCEFEKMAQTYKTGKPAPGWKKRFF